MEQIGAKRTHSELFEEQQEPFNFNEMATNHIVISDPVYPARQIDVISINDILQKLRTDVDVLMENGPSQPKKKARVEKKSKKTVEDVFQICQQIMEVFRNNGYQMPNNNNII